MAQKKAASSMKSQKASARVRDLAPSKDKSDKVKGGLRKLPGKVKPADITLKRGMTRS